jgi:DNA-binding NarL/FixJ family response regulator
VTGEAATASEVLEKVRRRRWDVVVLDVNLPDRSGLDLLRDLKQERPNMPVLVLAIRYEDQSRDPGAPGGGGVLHHEGEQRPGVGGRGPPGRRRRTLSLPPPLAERLAAASGAERLPHKHLSAREFQVLYLLASGKSVSRPRKGCV